MAIRIITLSLFLILTFLITTGIIYVIASSVCLETETVPFRYVGSDGAFSSVEKLETTEKNMDGYMEKCIKHHKAKFFAWNDNLESITTPTEEFKLKQSKE